MTRTLIQQARDAGDLMAFFDFRGGNFNDQSGNGVTLTVPASAQLSRDGLRVTSTPASFPLDMSAVQNFGVFALWRQWYDTGESLSIIAELTLSGTGTTGWQLYQGNGNANCLLRYGGPSGNSSASYSAVSDGNPSGRWFMSGHIDRRKSYESAKLYVRGKLAFNAPVTNNTNDGSTFADDTVYLMARGSNQFPHAGFLQAFGIVDFTTNQWTATEQAQLYAEIRDRRTL